MNMIDSFCDWAVEHDHFWINDVVVWIDWRVRGVRCVFIGHKIKYGSPEMYEPNWCARCFCNEDMADIGEENGPNTIPGQLIRLYIYACDHWAWFEGVDVWIMSHVKRLPDWWRY